MSKPSAQIVQSALSVSDFTNNYKAGEYSYPLDLVNNPNDEYGGNFVVFYINVQSQSKLLNQDTAIVQNAITGLNKNMSNISTGTAIAVEATKGAIAGGVVSAVSGLLSGSADAGKVSAGAAIKNAAKALAAPVGGALLKGGAVGLTDSVSGGFSQPVKRLKTAIALYMPPQLSTTYGVNYTESEMPWAMQMAQTALDGNWDGVKSGLVAKTLSSGSSTADALSKMSKLASNPTTEMIFKSVDTRTFTFNYRFAPKSEKEASNVLNIIEQFKFHMHPEFKDTTGFLYIYPSEFDIVYYTGKVQ